jgi:hypothetical protein
VADEPRCADYEAVPLLGQFSCHQQEWPIPKCYHLQRGGDWCVRSGFHDVGAPLVVFVLAPVDINTNMFFPCPAWLLRSNPASIDPSFVHEGASGSTAGGAPGIPKPDENPPKPKSNKPKPPPKAKTPTQEAKGALWFTFKPL